MWYAKWVVLLWSLWAAQAARLPTPPVRVSGDLLRVSGGLLRVSGGLLRGSIASSGTHAQYFGIPYATITQRFQAPGPEPKWDGVLDADNEHIRCRQTSSSKSNITVGQEDCLILNVYTPLNSQPENPVPVMVYIHGGSFIRRSSSPQMFGPEHLVSKDVVLVTLNYRLGAQGFMCLGIKEAPGNAGMKDQVAALRWIQRNIRKFGGDPDNVTLFGQSAGAASVSLHVLSPMSKGLFHRVILESGSSISAWAFKYDPIHRASLQAKEMGFDNRNASELYKFFMSKSDKDLVVTRLPRQEGTTITGSETIHAPCVEENIDGEEPFLTDLPYNIYTEGDYNKVPMIIGSNSEEGLLFAAADDPEFFQKVDFEKGLPTDLEFPSNETRRAVAKAVKEMYLGDKEISKETALQVSRFYGEPYINYGSVEETNLVMRTCDQPVWHYLFGYSGKRNLLKIVSSLRFPGEPGATHSDELFYIFSQPLFPTVFEWDMVEKMTTMWTNFAKYGDPTPTTSGLLPVKWPPVRPEDQRALYIDKEFKTIPLWYSDSLLYWREVYSKYRRKYNKNNAY